MDRFSSQIFTTQGTDINKWQSLANRSPQADIFFMPEYSMLFEHSEGKTKEIFGGEATLFFYGDADNYIVYPFFRRKINVSPLNESSLLNFKEWLDIISPYGYSGPISYITQSALEDCLWNKFFEEFHSYCIENNIVSEFMRLNPYIKNHIFLEKDLNNSLKIAGKVIYINLSQDKSIIIKSMDKGNRSSLSKAIRNGIEIFHSKNKEEIDTLYYLYFNTMKKNQADDSYFFSKIFFHNILLLLNKNAELFLARYKNKIIAASLFLFKGDFFHYYLSGSDAEFLSLCPNNLLLYEAIIWAKERDFKIFNLGGGNRLSDGLFRFKSSFSKAHIDFYTYSRIHNEEIYRLLCETRDISKVHRDKDAIKSDYFPAYRR